jgi:hypothetical protein
MLAFVEGDMERQFINMNFKYVRVVPVQNSVTWSVQQLFKQITTAYMALDQQVETIVWLDREKRQETADEIRTSIYSALVEVGVQPDQLHIIVNDRMSENIILSDKSVIRSVFNMDGYDYNFEGQHGKGILKDLYKGLGINYKELVHGVGLLKKIRIKECAKSSASLQSFVTTFTRNCWWVDERPDAE